MDMLIESLMPKDQLKSRSRELFIQRHTFAEKPEITINLVATQKLSIVPVLRNCGSLPLFLAIICTELISYPNPTAGLTMGDLGTRLARNLSRETNSFPRRKLGERCLGVKGGGGGGEVGAE